MRRFTLRLSPEAQQRMEDVYKQNPGVGRHSLAKMAGVTPYYAERFLENKPKREREPVQQTEPDTQIDTKYSTDTAEIITKSPRIKSLAEALEEAKVDLTVWEVGSHTVNFWTVTLKNKEGQPEQVKNYQIKAWLKRKVVSVVDQAMTALTEQLLKRPRYLPEPAKKVSADPHMMEISLFDHHFGKLAWGAETGSDYDVKIAERLYLGAVEGLIRKAQGFDIETILLPIGQDFLHVNAQNNMTANNTPQDVDSRLAKIFQLASMAVIRAVEMCSAVAPVEILWVPGNHDKQSSWYLVKYLEAYYRMVEHITVDAAPTVRKYKHYGINLIGFTHGDEEPHRDLPTIMAGECREIWSQVKQCEWHVGHLHKKKEMRTVTGDTFGSVMVRVLPSLSGTDAWHYAKGFVAGMRAAESYLWSRKNGYSGHFSVNTRELGEVTA
jgi:hypothetical protein